MSKQPSLEAVRKIMDHDRTRTSWVCRVTDGKIERIARVCVQYPAKGHAERPLRVAVTDWGKISGRFGEPNQFVGQANGYGYDKLAAALSGATVGGVEIGDHCDGAGRPLLRDLCCREGWEVIGDL